MLTRVMEIAAKQLLMAGVTTTVDLGAPLAPSLEHPRSDQQGRGCRHAGPRQRAVDLARLRRRDAGRLRRRQHHLVRRRPAQQADKLAAAGVDLDQGALRPDARRLQGDRRRRAQASHQRPRPCLRRDRRPQRARDGRRRAAARRLGRHRAAVQQGADHRHRQRRASGRRHRGASRLGLSRRRPSFPSGCRIRS